MSHYSYVKAAMTDPEIIVECLREFGFEPTEYEEPVSLYGYAGDERSDKAHIVVRKEQISAFSNDLGFLKTEDGYSTIISEYDERTGSGKRGYGLGPNFVQNLKVQYATLKVRNEVAKVNGLEIESVETVDGKLKIKIGGKASKGLSSSLSSSL